MILKFEGRSPDEIRFAPAIVPNLHSLPGVLTGTVQARRFIPKGVNPVRKKNYQNSQSERMGA